MRSEIILLSLLALCPAFQACVSTREEPPLLGTAGAASPPLELGLMWPSFPSGEPPGSDEVELGRELFFDTHASLDSTVSCASCHLLNAGYSDPRRVSLGVHAASGRRNSPGLWNAAFFENYGWSGKHASIEAQSLAALTDEAEMGVAREAVAARLTPAHRAQLERIYGQATVDTMAQALAAFQRTLIAGDAPFDRYIYGGQRDAVSDSAKRGFEVFLGRARCIQCHAMRSEASHPFGGDTGLYTDDRFHNLGVGYGEAGEQPDDLGRYEETHAEIDRGAFKTPTLRNVVLTAPYMHDGSLATLEAVVDHYDKGGVKNPNLDFDINPLHLTLLEKADLVAFLKSLTSTKLAAPQPRN